MSSNTEALQVLASETKKIVQDLLGSASFDVTRKGKITEVLDNNKYSVNIDGTVYTVPSCVTIGFAVNDTVLVISCQNDAKKNYIIGKSNAIKGESDSITADMLKSVYDVNGNGIVDNAERVNGFTVGKSVPQNAVFTDTIYTHPSTHSADIIVDGSTNKAYTATEKTKLSGIANSANNYTHPSTHSADIITDGTTNKAYTATEKAKLSGVATGATVNDTDINLKNRANHTGTQPASTISDFNSAALTAAPAETVVSVGALVNGAIAKNTPVDADMIPLMDSADSNKIKKLSWAYVKSVLSSTFAALVHTHTVSSLSDLTATATELNYTDGVTSAIQTQLNAKSPIASPTFTGTVTAPSFSGALSGNASTATKLATARTLSLIGDVSGSLSFDGSSDASITAIVADDSHNHIISNIDNLQTILDGKAPLTGVSSGSWQIGEKIFNVAHCLYTGTPTEILIKTGIPFVSSSHMPVIHIEGYAYGLQSPIELKIGYYVYGGAHGWCGAVSMGAWRPTIKLFTYLVGSDKYTGIALIGNIYYPQFAVHVQTEMGGNYTTGWTIESNMADNTVYSMPNTDVVTVPYKSTFSQVVSLTGDVTGSASITGVENTSIETTISDNSHNHIASNITDFDVEISNNTDVAANTLVRHTHSNKTILDATTASFTTADEAKLDGIATGANNYTHPSEHAPSIITQDSSNRFVTDTEKSTWNGKLSTNGGGSNLTETFTQAATRTNIATGETHSTIFGKIAKWFADFGAAAWMNTGSTSTTVALGNHGHRSNTLYMFADDVRTVVLTGLSTATNAVISATDTILVAFGKLQAQLNAKAPLASPTFTGTPAAPTATSGTNTTQIATTAFVQLAVGASSGGTTIVVSATQPSSQSVGDFWLAVL